MRCTRHGRACGEPPTVIHNPHNSHRYVVRDLLGKGGFARVYAVVYVPDDQSVTAASAVAGKRGEHGSLAPQQPNVNGEYRRYAMKVISKCRLGDTAAGRAALRNEVSIHRQLQHPAIVRLVAYWEDQYRIYLLMHFVDGPQLEHFVHARGRLTEQEACVFAAHILEALSYLHANRIVHRDLKLANLLLTHDRTRVMLCDFGLAAHLDTLKSSESPSVCGTPNYVAPELLTGSVMAKTTGKKHGHASYHKSMTSKGGGRKQVVYTTSADMWSMGVVLYSMLVGSGPFDSEDLSRTFRRIRTARFTFPIGLKISPNAKSLIRSLLAEDHAKRPTADQALRHPFFSAHDVPKLIVRPHTNHDLNGENGEMDVKPLRDSIRIDRDQRVDRVDERGGDKNRRLGTMNRRSVEVRRRSGANPHQAPRQHSTSGIAEDGQGSMRGERPASVREDRDRLHHYSNRTLARAARERSSSLCTPEVLEKAGNHVRRSSLNARTLHGLNETKRVGVSAAGRRISFTSSDQRTEVLNLSVTLSAALMRGRKYLDEEKTAKGEKKMGLEYVARRVGKDEKSPPLVRRWLDYTSKYGFATMMDDGRTSCCFNDGSIMFFVSESSDIPDFAYVPPRGGGNAGTAGEEEAEAEKQRENDLSKKACLCTLFADMMVDGGRGSMYDLPSACNVSFLKPDSEASKMMSNPSPGHDHKDKVHVREWARFRHFRAAAFRLSNHSIHVKFDVGEDRCDDFLFTPADGMLFYREAKGGVAWRCSVRNLGEFSAHSEYLHKQLELCSQGISRFLE